MKETRNGSNKSSRNYVNKNFRHQHTFAPEMHNLQDKPVANNMYEKPTSNNDNSFMSNGHSTVTNNYTNGRHTDMGFRTVEYDEYQTMHPMYQSFDGHLDYIPIMQPYPRYSNMNYGVHQSFSPEPMHGFHQVPHGYVDPNRMSYSKPVSPAQRILKPAKKVVVANKFKTQKKRIIPKNKIVIRQQNIISKSKNYQNMFKKVSFRESCICKLPIYSSFLQFNDKKLLRKFILCRPIRDYITFYCIVRERSFVKA
jgi:hypothetical protein